MANKTMTRAEAIALAIAAFEDSNVPANVEACEVLRKMHAQLTKPKAATGKSKTAIENEAHARKLYDIAPDTLFDGKFVMEHLTGVLTPQKVVGIMRVGIALGLFERVQEGKRVMYRTL